jgi:hypothetical protein
MSKNVWPTVALGKSGCHHPISLVPDPPYPADFFARIIEEHYENSPLCHDVSGVLHLGGVVAADFWLPAGAWIHNSSAVLDFERVSNRVHHRNVLQ